jgi:hypothetical protein
MLEIDVCNLGPKAGIDIVSAGMLVVVAGKELLTTDGQH